MIFTEVLCKSFRGISVLRDVTFRQARGEVVALIGPSGGGKSTLLRCLNCLERPTSGRVGIGDLYFDADEAAKPAVQRERQRQLRLRSGMVFQHFHLFPHLTALGNIMEAPMAVKRLAPSQAEALARGLLEKVGLSERAGAYPSQLSGGQQQRIAIARALAMTPEVMLFDEPTSALDPELRDEVRRVIRQLADEGTTMLLVTHEMAFARDIADQVAFLDDGRLLEMGPPEQLFGEPREPRTRAFLRRI